MQPKAKVPRPVAQPPFPCFSVISCPETRPMKPLADHWSAPRCRHRDDEVALLFEGQECSAALVVCGLVVRGLLGSSGHCAVSQRMACIPLRSHALI